MVLQKLSCHGFRNLKDITLEFSPNLNLIVGENAQGKTNLLEALWLLTGERSFRHAKNDQLVGFGSDFTQVKASFLGGGRENISSFSIKNHRLRLSLNHLAVQNSGNTGFAAVVFSPEHLSIIKSGPGERRDFLDMGIGQLKSRYRGVLGEYNRILKQRNALLKMDSNQLDLQLDILDEQLGKIAMIIKKTRETYLAQLAPKATHYFGEMCGGLHQMSLAYESQLPDTLEDYLDLLKVNRNRDIMAKTSIIGVHRDDFSVLIDEKPARLFGSQGQQRSCVLALKLAEAFLFGEFLGEPPIVLLDDVLSELDQRRRSFLLSQLSGPQIFITACEDQKEFEQFPLKLFKIHNGQVQTGEE